MWNTFLECLEMTKGKNFSCNNVDDKRHKSDFYQTPYCLTNLLLEKEDLIGSVLEPACGYGAIVKCLPRCDKCYDIGFNFFNETESFGTVITNPPFSLAKEFILKAKEVANNKIMFLLPLSYLHGKERYDIIYSDRDFPLKKVYVFTRYPLLEDTVREDGKHKTGMMVYAWFVWEKGYKGNPEIAWLDNNDFVVKKGNENE